MARGRRRNRRNTPGGGDHLPQEEQGDLLTEAPGGVMGEGGVPSDVEPAEEAGGRPSTEEPEVGREVDEAVADDSESKLAFGEKDSGALEESGEGPSEPDPPEEAEPQEEAAEPREEAAEPPEAQSSIPESPWEQKMAWAKERVRSGRREDALELYRELVAEDPSSVRAWNNLGILLDEMGEHGEAAACLTRAQELEPQNLEVAGNLGAALGALGKYAQAEEQLRRVLRQEPENVAVRANLGILFFRRGLYETAEEELAAVCRANPEHGLAFYYRGEALNRVGRVEEAIEALERAVELSPNNARAYYTLGILFDRKNLPEEAAVLYRKSRDLSRQ